MARGGRSRVAHSRYSTIGIRSSQSMRPTSALTPAQRELRQALDEEAEAEAMADDSRSERTRQ